MKGVLSVGINTIWINRRSKEIPEGVVAVGNLLEVYNTDLFK